MWLAENPWPVVIGLGLIAAVAAVWGLVSGRAKFLIAAVVCGLLAGGTWFVAGLIETEAERIENRVRAMGDAAVAGDVETVVSYFSPDAAAARLTIRAGLALAEVGDDLRLTDWITRVSDDGRTATCHFRANATFSVPAYGFEGRHPTRFTTDWVKNDDGEWLLAGVTRLHPITGETIGIRSAD